MEPNDLKAWLERNHKDFKYLVLKLGVSGSQVFYWLDGSRSIPKWLPYALAGLEKEDEKG